MDIEQLTSQALEDLSDDLVVSLLDLLRREAARRGLETEQAKRRSKGRDVLSIDHPAYQVACPSCAQGPMKWCLKWNNNHQLTTHRMKRPHPSRLKLATTKGQEGAHVEA